MPDLKLNKSKSKLNATQSPSSVVTHPDSHIPDKA